MADLNQWSIERASEISDLNDQTSTKRLGIVAVVARIVTIATLVAAIAITKSNKIIFDRDGITYFPSYKPNRSFKHALSIMVVGLAYSAVQTPFAVYYAMRGKRLINHNGLLQFDYYGDKVISYLLATAAGAYFGATTSGKRFVDQAQYADKVRLKFDNFYSTAYAAAALIFVGFMGSVVSSIISSRPRPL